MYKEIIAVCCENHTKHVNILCGGKCRFFFLILNAVVRIVTTGTKQLLRFGVTAFVTKGPTFPICTWRGSGFEIRGEYEKLFNLT
jgi:hypothetical protein